MMPTAPPPSLSFRTSGSPQYGWKAGISGGAFPELCRVKPAPDMPRQQLGLRPPFVRLAVNSVFPRCVGPVTRLCTAMEGGGDPPPQGPSLGSGLCCPGPSSLNRPHPPHLQAHHDFTIWRLIRDAFAVRERRGDPQVVPGFRWTFLPDMPSSMTPGSSRTGCVQCSSPDTGLRRDLSSSALPFILQSASRGARFRGFLVRICYGLPGCSPPWADLTWLFTGHRGLLLPGFQRLGLPRRCRVSLRQPLDSSVGGTFTHWNASVPRCTRSGRADLPHPGWDRKQARRQSTTGSSCSRLCLGTSPVPHPVPWPGSCFSPCHPGRRDFPGPVGDVTFFVEPFLGARRLKRWPACLGAHRVCSKGGLS